MKNSIKQEKGVSLIALVITIIIMIILTNVLIYNAQDSLYIKKLTNLYTDIELLRDKVSEYYIEYGKIPAQIKYTNTNQLSDVLSVNNDIGDFYVIDLEAMQGITLNYGKDYNTIKNDIYNANSYTDVYIINESSHNIFYVQGIRIEENNTTKTYYTDYTEPDETTIDLKYIDGILIPNGYYYIGKYTYNSGNESIVVSQNKNEQIDSTSQTQYIWQKQISTLEKTPDSIILSDSQNESEFLKSVNTYKGYFKNKNKTTNIDVVYIKIDENKWSEIYSKECEYTDINGDKATIPAGFKVSMSENMNTIAQGLVAKDESGNEWVWIEVPSIVFTTAENSTQYDKIKTDLKNYTSDYKQVTQGQEEQWKDEWYSGCGIQDSTQYNNMYNKMLESVYKNNGFWISRYEIGDSTSTKNNYETRTTSSGTTGTPVSQKNQIPYNLITCEEAQQLANTINKNTDVTGSLLFGIQWDLVCKFLEEKTDLTKEEINIDSTNWGNYKNSGLKSNESLRTGESEQTRKLNIYDFAGNDYEWTLEKSNKEAYPSIARSGSYVYEGYTTPSSIRFDITNNERWIDVGFRCTIY